MGIGKAFSLSGIKDGEASFRRSNEIGWFRILKSNPVRIITRQQIMLEGVIKIQHLEFLNLILLYERILYGSRKKVMNI